MFDLTTDNPALDKLINERVEAMLPGLVEKTVEARLAALNLEKAEVTKPKKQIRKVAIIASKGTLDMAYPPLILATAAAAMGAEVTIFFTFYGLNIIRKQKNESLQVAPVGNPAMPVPMPNILGMLPGMTPAATRMMRGMFKQHNVETIPQLLQDAIDSDVRLIGCQMTMDVMGIKKEEFVEGVEVGGAATFMRQAFDADVSLFI